MTFNFHCNLLLHMKHPADLDDTEFILLNLLNPQHTQPTQEITVNNLDRKHEDERYLGVLTLSVLHS